MKKTIVSLTSFPAAMPFAVRAIQTILDGSVLPDKVVLYLTSSQFPNKEIPTELQNLVDQNPIIEIRFYDENIRSYTKLIPALKDFPNDIIVTVDDDNFYHKNMLRNLLRRHKQYPNAIVAHRIKRIELGVPYRKWKKFRKFSFLISDMRPKFSNMQTGVGGVLYPPNALKMDMLDPNLFMEMAPTTDDVWFWAAAVANETKIVPVSLGLHMPRGLGKPTEISLMAINIKAGVDVNRNVLEKVFEKYPSIKQKIAK